MIAENSPFLSRATPSRRCFVTGLAAIGAGAVLNRSAAWGQTPGTGVAELSGAAFDLSIDPIPFNATGRPRMATAINGSVPAPTLRWREGDTLTLNVTNRLAEDSSIHWHGIYLPSEMDGVPGLSFRGIAPGETFTYRFPVKQSGTYWYHSHSGFQEQRGVYAPLVIEPREPEAESARGDREHVVMLSDWTDENPDRLFRKLKKQSDYYNFRQRTVGDFFRDVRAEVRKVTWPTMDELKKATLVIVIFVAILGIVIGLMDATFQFVFVKAVAKLF